MPGYGWVQTDPTRVTYFARIPQERIVMSKGNKISMGNNYECDDPPPVCDGGWSIINNLASWFTGPRIPSQTGSGWNLKIELLASDIEVTGDERAEFETHSPPLADAGPDQEVSESFLVTLDANNSMSYDNVMIESYKWEQTGGGVEVELLGSTEPIATFISPTINYDEEILVFHLTVKEISGLESWDVCEVKVIKSLSDSGNGDSHPSMAMPWIPLLLLDD